MTTRRTFGKIWLAAMAVVLAVTVGAQAVSAQAATAAAINSNKLTCQQVAPISVTLSPTDPTPYTAAGQLCAKGQLKGKTMQLLVHGLTYDHRYWDWPQTPQNSYVRSATDDGYATLAIDRIGDGASSHPADGNSVTTISSGYVIHQIVQKLRSGAIGGNAFHKIIAVGHSFGAASVGYEAGTYHDVDGVIISGFMHDSSPTTLAAFSAALYPASLDPQFANSGLNNTYLTTLPGTRAQFFFNSNVDPAVITKDEQIKQTGTTGELDPGTFEQVLAATTGITVPVFITMGDSDAIFCDTAAGLSCANSSAILAREQPHFGPKACLQAYVLRNSGHDMNLHRNAQAWFQAAGNWADSYVGTGAGHLSGNRCR